MTNNKEKRYDNIKWAVTFAVVIVLVISTVLVSLQAFTDIKPFDVFKNTGESETAAYSIVTDENGNELEEGTIHSMPAVLNITSNALALADNNFIEIMLTATVTPSSAMNKAAAIRQVVRFTMLVFLLSSKLHLTEWKKTRTVRMSLKSKIRINRSRHIFRSPIYSER